MRRVIYRMFLCTAGLMLVSSAGLMSGCIPAFRGFKPVTKTMLKPKKKATAPAEILVFNNYYRTRWAQVGSRNRVFWRRVMRIRYNKRSSFRHAKWSIRGELHALELRTVCPDGRVLRMGRSDIQQVTKETSNVVGYWSSEQNVYNFAAPGLDEGCVVDVMWEAEVGGVRNLPLQQRFPIKKGYFRYDYSDGPEMRVRLRNAEYLWIKLAKSQKSGKSKKGDSKSKSSKALTDKEKNEFVRVNHDRPSRHIELWLKDIPARPGRRFPLAMRSMLLPPRYAMPAMLDVDMIKTGGMNNRDLLVAWRNVDDSFTAPSFVFYETRSATQRNFQMDEQEETKDSLTKLARQITAQAGSRDAKIRTLYDHLRRRMRTLAPSTSSMFKLEKIYQLGKGTTYEINMMFVVMLRSLGIRAYLGLVSPGRRSKFPEDEPNDIFQTVATYIPPAARGKWRGLNQEVSLGKEFVAKKGDTYQGGREEKGGTLVDPSNKVLPYGKLPSSFSGTWVFVIDHGGGRFFRTPESNYKQNVYSVKIQTTLAKDGSFKGSTAISAWGQHAIKMRSKMAKSPFYKWLQGLGGYAKRTCGKDVELAWREKPVMDYGKLRNPFQFSYTFETKSCVPHGKEHLVLPLARLFPVFRVARLMSPKRLAPIHLGNPGITKYELEIALPAGYNLINKRFPRSVAASGPGVSMSMSLNVSGGKVKITGEFTRMRRELSPKAYSGVRKFYGKLKMLSRVMLLVGSRRIQ
ncbi:MAG: transglutaminase domain-containing protein [Deltaproteobacteria bacterium]|nr:MAG: transglutaminase domain-containing protein [Deltaproteobacteria bacterium]